MCQHLPEFPSSLPVVGRAWTVYADGSCLNQNPFSLRMSAMQKSAIWWRSACDGCRWLRAAVLHGSHAARENS